MSRNKGLVAKLSSLCIITLALTLVSIPESSFAKEPNSVNCLATTAVPHMAMKVATPSIKSPLVDRTITLNTNCGQIVFKAFGRKAPLTVIAMTALAKDGFFDKSLCHRLTTSSIFIIQCGDPTASGSGGPPFQYPNENLPTGTKNNYPAGTVAMANSGLDSNGNGTNSSQFFMVYKDTTLAPTYTIWGMVIKGLDVLKKVASAGVVGGGTDGKPKQTLSIDSVTIK